MPRPVPLRPHSTLRIPLGMGLLAAALLGLLAVAVVSHGVPQLDALEAHWMQAVHGQRSPGLTQGMLAVAELHDPLVAVLLSVAVTALLFQRRWRELPLLLLITLGGGVMNNLAKRGFARERPEVEALVSARGFGFPSGHTIAATLLVAWMLHLAWRRPTGMAWRAASLVAGASLVGIVAFSRVYLGAHYPSDVLAALLAGTAWACGCIAVFGVLPLARAASGPRAGTA